MELKLQKGAKFKYTNVLNAERIVTFEGTKVVKGIEWCIFSDGNPHEDLLFYRHEVEPPMFVPLK